LRLDAFAMREREPGRTPISFFRQWTPHGMSGLEDWYFHSQRCFPKFAPRKYFEASLRGTIEVEWLAAPVLFVNSSLL